MIRQRCLPLLLLGVAVLSAPQTSAGSQPTPVFGGLPQPGSWWQRLAVHTLENDGFLVGYSEWHRLPLWVGYRATPIPRTAPHWPRPARFSVDRRTLARVSAGDFRGQPFDRGHLAPSYLIARLYGRKAQEATFLMSNIAPQMPRLNQLLWQRLEEVEADVVAPDAGELWVLTGPVLEGGRRLASGVSLPTAFYRIWFDATPPRMLAFLVPQAVCGDEPLDRYVVAVDELERRTELDFFPAMPEEWQAALEAVVAPQGWQLHRYSRLPARYADNFQGQPCRITAQHESGP